MASRTETDVSVAERPPAMAAAMRAAVLAAPGRITIARTPVPQPGRSQALFRVEGCGVCASNLTPWSGPEWMRFPTAPGDLGHEAWGVVEAVGEDVTSLKPGDRIAALSYRAYAERDVVEEDAAIVLPAALDGAPFPGEPLGCAMNIFRRSDIARGQTMAIVGAGFLGLLLTQLATQAGARVIAISRRPYALQMARRMGAHETIGMKDHGAIIGAVREMTGGAFCERVIEAVGMQEALDLAGEITGERGRLIVAGYHQNGLRQVNMQLWNWRGLDVINAHERDPRVYMQGMREAVDAVVAGRMTPQALITHAFPLDRLDDALDATRDRPEGFMKAVVVP